MLRFIKCIPIKEGKFYTIILQGDADTDEISLIRLRGKPIKIVEEIEGEIPTIDKTILLEQIYQLQVEIMDKIAEIQTKENL